MDAKRIFFSLVFGVLGIHWAWSGARALRHRPAATDTSTDTSTDTRAMRRRAAGRMALGLLILVAAVLMNAPARVAP
jgi:hypothetical protein